MKCSRVQFLSWTGLIHGVVGLVLLLSAVLVFAQQDSSTRVSAAKLEPTKPSFSGWVLAAEFEIELGDKLREAVDRGLPLQFAVDFKLTRARWYWMDQELVSITHPYTLSYNALTRTYRLVTPSNTYSAPTLEDVLSHMLKLSNWPVIHRDQIEWGERYQAQVRFRLVLTELPKPFQISALVNSEWDLSSNWLMFEFIPRREISK